MVVNAPDEGVMFLGKRLKGISGSTIKFIAIISMLIDHTAAIIVAAIPTYTPTVYHVYNIMRDIGRLGFPIFCFLLVEGFMHTRSKGKYVFRLGLFALISEVPFDLAFNYQVFETGYQNVFFTLFLGMLAIIFIDKLWNIHCLKLPFRYILCIPVLLAAMYLANFLRTDYSATGVVTIVAMYFLRNFKVAEMYTGCMVLTLDMLNEAYAFLAMIPIALYNGKRGLKMKYFFYIFYPAHLLILAGIVRYFM